MSMATEYERIEALERQVSGLLDRLATSQAQTELALANTDRAIAQTNDAVALAQHFRALYESKESDPLSATLETTEKWYASEPLVHSPITDVLEESHPLAYKMVYCGKCESMVHADNNECMQTWLEWGTYILCGECAAPLIADGVLSASRFKSLATKEPWTEGGE